MTTTTNAAPYHTLQSLTDIFREATIVTHIDTSNGNDLRKAGVQAVLDAIGYKFPVDPEREAFEKWDDAHPSQSNTEDLFAAWKAGREQERKEAQMWLDEIEAQQALRKAETPDKRKLLDQFYKVATPLEITSLKQMATHSASNLNIPASEQYSEKTMLDFVMGVIERGTAKQPANDGWIPWSGGECPVAGNVRVECKCRNGDQETSEASGFDWSHGGGKAFDIIAYKLPQTTTP